jgi:hypothetical protein
MNEKGKKRNEKKKCEAKLIFPDLPEASRGRSDSLITNTPSSSVKRHIRGGLASMKKNPIILGNEL